MTAARRRVGLEVSVASLAGVRTARACGATRVELCGALELGGLTPSVGLLEAALDEAGGRDGDWQGVHVLLRPRPGDFAYSAEDLAVLERDLRVAVGLGVDGVVIGALDAEGRVDEAVLARLAEPARAAGVTVTFHRAVDVAADPITAVGRLADGGLVDRVLTSGGAPGVADGLDALARMVTVAAGRLEVMAGSGVTPALVPSLVAAGVDAVHLSAKRRLGGDAGVLALGVADDGGHWVTDGQVVRAAAEALSAHPR